MLLHFYPRSPRGERQIAVVVGSQLAAISIHAPREGRDSGSGRQGHRLKISIHAPREGSDRALIRAGVLKNISIHAPREGSDYIITSKYHLVNKFLSTLPARGATRRPKGCRSDAGYFYPRSPRGERQQKQRGKSLLLFYYTTLCTNLEELFLQKGKNWEKLCKAGLLYRCEGNGKTMGTLPSHGLAGEG